MVDHILSVPSVYANLGLAILALPNNLNQGGAGGDRWWIQMGAGNHGGGTIGVITGADATHYIEVSAAIGVNRSLVSITAFEDLGNHYTFAHDFSAVAASQIGSNGNNGVLQNISLRSSSSIGLYNNGTNGKIINCEVVCSNTNSSTVGFYSGQCFGCISKMTNGYGHRNGSAKNCIVSSPSTNFHAIVTGDNNCSTDATAPGVGSIKNALVADMKFTDYANNDFTFATNPLTEDSILMLAGGNQPTIYTADIDGIAIPLNEYPIGPHYSPSIAPQIPSLINPVNHAINIPIDQVFTWSSV